MADLSKIRLNNTNYNLKDKQVRDFLEKGWIPGGMEYVDFYNTENESYSKNYWDCAILEWQHDITQEVPNGVTTYFYSYNSQNLNYHYDNTVQSYIFYSPDGKELSYNTRASEWWYNDGNTRISSYSDDFPNIQVGYKLPSSLCYINISKNDANSYNFDQYSEIQNFSQISSSKFYIIAISDVNYVNEGGTHTNYPFLYLSKQVSDNNTNIDTMYFTSLPQSDGIVYQLTINSQNEISLTTINLHEPEDDEDVDDMLESLDLTVINDDNLIGSAEIGSGNVVDWNPIRKTTGFSR